MKKNNNKQSKIFKILQKKIITIKKRNKTTNREPVDYGHNSTTTTKDHSKKTQDKKNSQKNHLNLTALEIIMKNRKLLIMILLIVLFLNMSTVYSSWYDWSRYEVGIYSFEIPEGFEVKYNELSDNSYLSSDIGTINVHFGSEIGMKYVDEHIFYSNTKEILKYNDTTSFYTTIITNKNNNTKSYYTTGASKISNDTYLQITMMPKKQQSKSDYNKTIERDINIIKNMLESMEINKN